MKDKKPMDHLRKLILEELKIKFPSFPPNYMPINDYSQIKNKERRELLRIEKFTNLYGNAKANIITNTGTRRDNRKLNVGAMGEKRMIGSVQYTKSQMQNGISDLLLVVYGFAISVELKRKYKKGADRQSQVQMEYEQQIKNSGGRYIIVSSFEDFYYKFIELHEKLRIASSNLF